MIYLPANVRVFLAPGSTDMRKAINSLSILVEGALALDPFSGHIFVFCNRGRTILKILYWERNGFGKKGLRSTASNGRKIEMKLWRSGQGN